MAVKDLILLAVELMLVAVLISYAVSMKDSGVRAATTVNEDISKTNISISNQKYTRYNNVVVSGADVINAIEMCKTEGISVSVLTKTTDTELETVYTADSSIPVLGTETYINPAADFVGIVEENSTYGYVTTIKFEQVVSVGAVPPAEDDDNGNGTGGVPGSGTTNIIDSSLLSGFNQTVSDLTEVLNNLTVALENNIVGGSGNGGSSTVVTGNVTQALTDIQTALDSIDTQLESADFDGVKENLNTLSGDITSLASTVSDLQTTIQNQSGNTGTSGITQAEFQSLVGKITDIATTVTTVSQTMATQTDLKSLKEAITGTDSNSVVKRLESLQKSVNGLESNVEKLQKTVDKIASALGVGGT